MSTSVIAALIAATFAYTGFVLTKENKVSEFRQLWINELRKDIASFIGLLNQLCYNSAQKQDEINNRKKIKKILLLKEKIILRLNPKDDKKIIEIIEELIEHLYQKGYKNYDIYELVEHTEQLHAQLHKLLKKEWEIVKQGEPWFFWTKTTFIASVILAGIIYGLPLLIT